MRWKEIQVQVGRRTVFGIGMRIAAVEKAPVGLARLRAADVAEADAGLGHLAPLGTDVLALLLLQRRQEILEVAIAGIDPVELDAAAQHEAGFLQ